METSRNRGNSLLNRLFGRFFKSKRVLRDDRNAWNSRLVQSLSRTRFPSWRQIRHLPEVLSSNDSLRLQLGVLCVLFGLGIFGTQFYFSHSQMVPAIGGILTEGLVGTPRSLNPVLAPSNDVDADLARLTYSSLFAADADGALSPDLVDTFDISADQKTYTLNLRQAKWHDGQALTADDVIFTFSLLQDPNWKSPLQAEFRDVTVDKVSDSTVRFSLKSPFAPFLSELTFGIAPKHIWKNVNAQDVLQAEANLKPVGSGPFEFSDVTRDGRGFVLTYDLKRNPDYFRQAPYLEGISFRFYPDFAGAVDALKKHQVDSLGFVPRDLRTDLASVGRTVVVSLELPQYTAVFFNQTRNPVLKDKAVRQALAMSVNKSRVLLDVLHGEGRPIDGPPLPGNSASNTESFEPETAGKMLDEDGWKIDTDGLRKKTISKTVVPLRLTLTAVNQPESMAAADIIKQSWTAIGVGVEIFPVEPSDAYRTVIKPRAYDALLYGQLLGADPDPYPFWHSSQAGDPGQNLAMLVNRQADDAIEKARATTDEPTREAQYGKFQAVLANEIPAVFLYSPTYAYPMPDELKGFAGTRIPAPSDRFATVTQWYLKSKRAWK